jgi:hypothetical protein
MLTVITGPPCSGKTTYLHQHALPGDIKIDFDDLAQALGSAVRHGHGEEIRRVTIAARSAAIEAAIQAHRRGARAWVVDMAPPPRRLGQYERAGARLVTLTADPETLHARASQERPLTWHALIDQWLATGGQTVLPPWCTE